MQCSISPVAYLSVLLWSLRRTNKEFNFYLFGFYSISIIEIFRLLVLRNNTCPNSWIAAMTINFYLIDLKSFLIVKNWACNLIRNHAEKVA